MISRLPGQGGQTLLAAIRLSRHAVRAPCAGSGRCGRCRVRVLASADSALDGPSASELAELSPVDLARGVRLACCARFRHAGTIELELDDERIAIPAEHLTVRFGAGERQAAIASGRPLAVAVDIGTTTLAVCLVDAQSNAVLSVRTEANAQKSWGSDVVARIQAVRETPAALPAQRDAIVRQVDRLIHQQLKAALRSADELGLVAVAGNTTMLHLLVGADPSGMACMPFAPVFLDARRVPARACGFALPAACDLLVLPAVSSFVGADIVAGVLATGLDRAIGVELLLDIGTNGEMVLGNAQGLIATATAAGPAFEGAQIAHGCPGVAGALDHAGEGAEGFWYTTIADAPLRGICGSGLLDLIAWLRRSGAVDETGLLEMPGGEREFRPDPAFAVGIDQRDIRQLQLAKGAIAAGITILCERAGVAIDEIACVHLAGGFGTLLRADSAIAIGLLPQGLRGRVQSVGNTSLKGALLALSSDENLARCARIAGTVTPIDLSRVASFQATFADCMLFPEAFASAPPPEIRHTGIHVGDARHEPR